MSNECKHNVPNFGFCAECARAMMPEPKPIPEREQAGHGEYQSQVDMVMVPKIEIWALQHAILNNTIESGEIIGRMANWIAAQGESDDNS